MKRSVKGLISLGAAASLCALSVGVGYADSLSADGDSLSASNNYTITDCSGNSSRVASTSSGVASLAGTGNGSTNLGQHFQPGTVITFSSTPSAAAAAKSITASVAAPASQTLLSSGNTNNWNNDHGLITKAISASIPAGVPSGSYQIDVKVSGTNNDGSGALQLTASYQVVVSCSDTTAPSLTLPSDITKEATGSSTTATWTASATDANPANPTVTCAPSSGSGFAVGTTSVSCSATDAAGNTASGGFNVIITDTTPPTVTAPANKSAEATSSSGAAVTYSGQTASDLVDGTITPTCAPASGSTFPLGTTTVTCSATDAHANTGSATFTVTVGDSTAPSVTVPADITKEATGPAGAVATFTASASDAVDGPLAASCAPASGSTFGIATTTVTCSATDAHSNTGSADFHVTVQDTTPPTLSGLPATQTIEATSASGAPLASFAPSASDIVDGAVAVVCKTAGNVVVTSSTVYPLDATTVVSCTATDAHNNVGTGGYSVTVQDKTGPSLTVPTNMVVEATSSAGAPATFAATATDAVDGAVVPDCNSLSGSTFPFGTSTVSCTATDSHGNASNTQSFTITVVDTTAPTIDSHANLTAEATGPGGAGVSYTSPATHDAVDGDGTASCLPASGSTFALGSSTVTCNATDAHGNSATPTTFTITVQDTTPPTIAGHGDETAEATSADGAVVTYTPPGTSDLVDGSGVATCLPASGTTFALGSTTVTCTATDAHSNAAAPTTFDVKVQDTTAPDVTVPGQQVAEATSAAGASVSFDAATWTDAVDGSGTAACDHASGATYPLGTTTVTCTQTDKAGNEGENSFMVVVQDTTAPIIDPHADVTAEATAANGAVVTYTSPATSDAVDGAGTASCTPTSGTQFAFGDTTVNCFAADQAENASIPTSFVIHVVDTTPPTIASHADVTVEATGPSGATVAYSAPATSDLVDGAGVAGCTPSSGGTFALGSTTVTCTATDAHGNAAAPTTFVIHVVDTTAPVIAFHGDATAEATSAAGAVVTYTAPATSDAVDGAGTATCLPASGSTFALGSTTVTCTASDAASNTATPTTFSVIVRDTTAPAIASHADVIASATSASGAVVSYSSPTWTDAVDGTGTTSCTPASGSTFAIGTTQISCTVTDAHGNSATSHFNVIVSYGWHGFFQPIDALANQSNGKDSSINTPGTILNKAKAGSSIPVKFDLSGNMGLGILAAGSPAAGVVTCDTATLQSDVIEETTTTSSGLKYDATTNAPYGQYNYTWKTQTAWAGKCVRFDLKLADGTNHYAFFNFTK